jgi:hypothetical protein
MATKFPNSGRLNYSQRKINQKSPDLYGDITFDRAYLKSILEETDGDEILVKLDAWQNDGQYGTYFSLKVNTWKKPETGQAQPPAPPRPQAPPPADESDVPF